MKSETLSEPLSHSVHRHLRFGWWSLLVFLTLGLVLEALHGFKAAGYLNVSNSTRRLMWTLAHAHGTLLSLLHIGFAWTVRLAPAWRPGARTLASSCLTAATVLIPGGFFLAGINARAGDPGIGFVLIPLGAVLLVLAVIFAARGIKQGFVISTTEMVGESTHVARSGDAPKKADAKKSARSQ